MPNFALYDSNGNIQGFIGGTSDQVGSAFLKANTPAGLQPIEVTAENQAVIGSPNLWVVQNQKFVQRS